MRAASFAALLLACRCRIQGDSFGLEGIPEFRVLLSSGKRVFSDIFLTCNDRQGAISGSWLQENPKLGNSCPKLQCFRQTVSGRFTSPLTAPKSTSSS